MSPVFFGILIGASLLAIAFSEAKGTPRWLLAGGGVLVFFLGSLLSLPQTPTAGVSAGAGSVQASASTAQKRDTQTANNHAPPHAGEWERNGPWQYRVVGWHYIVPGVVSSCQPTGQFFFVNVQARNVSKSPQILNGQYMTYLKDSQGRRYAWSLCATMDQSPNGQSWVLDTVNPGETETSELIFDIPPGMSHLGIELGDGSLNTVFITIALHQ